MNNHIDWFQAIDLLSANRTLRPVTLLPELEPYWAEWSSEAAQAAMRPLRITVEIVGILAGYNHLNLDNLLARLVLDRALDGAQLDDSQSPYLLPAPLKILWRHPQTGHPLYAANPFAPASANLQLTIWWHKRFIRPELAAIRPGVRKGEIQPNQGRFKEKRTPLPAQTAAVWSADCIGNADAISELLRLCTNIGKRRMAIVEQWTIAPLDEFHLSRPVPLAYLGYTDSLPLDAQFCGWTPPYWPGVPECQGWCAAPH